MPDQIPDLLTVEDVAKTLRIKPKRVYELDGLRRLKIGRRVRIHPDDLQRYLDRCDQREVRRAG
ncbi:MAG TPA: helix-turn-helix domain-containing protein [Candidatus Limnocylindria bacterium]|nr:helix-turn-helix domain-containing protein [Candidatus Limnocylindria bacterium]